MGRHLGRIDPQHSAKAAAELSGGAAAPVPGRDHPSRRAAVQAARASPAGNAPENCGNRPPSGARRPKGPSQPGGSIRRKDSSTMVIEIGNDQGASTLAARAGRGREAPRKSSTSGACGRQQAHRHSGLGGAFSLLFAGQIGVGFGGMSKADDAGRLAPSKTAGPSPASLGPAPRAGSGRDGCTHETAAAVRPPPPGARSGGLRPQRGPGDGSFDPDARDRGDVAV